jgi:lipoate-protein ligase B
MDAAARALAAGEAGPRLLLLEHPPTITTGVRSSPASFLRSPGELARSGVAVCAADRGGDATWHGPGQLVGYPVVDLRALSLPVPGYVDALERGLVAWLAGRGARCGARPGLPGVWTAGGRKIASIGVRVARGIATHGFALNLRGDLFGADAIVPCGLAGVALTTLEAETGDGPAPSDAARGVAAAIATALRMELAWPEPERSP